AKRTGNDDLSVRLLGLEGALAGRRGRSDECVALWTERLECARRSGNLAAEADSLTDLGTVAFQAGDYAEAERLVTEALTPAEKAERFDLVATVYIMRGLICAETGRGEEALRWVREAQTAASRATGSPLIFVFTNLGRVFLTCGAAEEAEAAYGLALKLASSGKRHFHIQGALLGLSKTREAQGDDEGSARCLIAAKKLGGQIESRRTVDADERLKNVRTKLAGTAGSAVFDELASQPWERIVAEIVAQLGS
ncbi:MAG TPA: tetratricopeptide repeat protein, partial [Fimbriimonadaceae bacterium]|nr:tetratricopeptide repeat protein [Fimbriimonadaceae bacterium]